MFPIQRIEFYICIFQVIFQHFGTLAATVSMNQHITGLLGSNDTHLTCSFFLEEGENIIGVQINAKNILEDFDDDNIIATFKPEKAARTYLAKRVTLTNITHISTNATLTFNVLKCEDEKFYICKIFYNDKFENIQVGKSEATRISVKVKVNVVHIKNAPNKKQYDHKTENITLTCKANGNPEPSYQWFKDNNKSSILSTTDIYVIEDVIRNNSGVYICQASNTINNVIYNNSTSVKIDIVEEILSTSESVSSKVSSATYAVPIFLAVGLIIIFLAVIYKKYFSKQVQIEKYKESSWRNKIACLRSCDCCIKKPDYTTVVHNITNTVAPEDDSNGLKENKISCRNREVDFVKTDAVIQIIPTASSNDYADPKDILPLGIVKDRGKYEDHGDSDQSEVYAEVIDPAKTKYEMSKSRTSVTSETLDHNNIPEDHCHV